MRSFQKEDVIDWLQNLQQKIVSGLEALEPRSRFKKSEWQRPGGGGGLTRVISEGEVFEKGGVNTSVVFGELPKALAQKLGTQTTNFFATGISIVLHPRSPQIPTVHANWRYFEQPDQSWFGGGADLTPYTLSEQDFKHFHSILKKGCDLLGSDTYSQFKKACDEYFYLPHRGEHRGIGGIFFDYRKEDLDPFWKFIQKSGESFLEAYLPIVERGLKKSFTPRQKKFQLLRRGRYVEFNLVYDRGTLFGLQTKGNIESILMSLPPEVHFEYDPNLESTDEEKTLMDCFKKAREWV